MRSFPVPVVLALAASATLLLTNATNAMGTVPGPLF